MSVLHLVESRVGIRCEANWGAMMRRFVVGVGMVALAMLLAFGEEKKTDLKTANLNFIQKADTVAVVIFPGASAPLDNPNANTNAQNDVEQALTKWGRFRLTMDTQNADIVIAIRKGNSRPLTPTVGGGPVNDRPVILQPSDNGIRIGGQRGTPPPTTRDQTTFPQPDRPQMGTAIASDDEFEVYLGKQEYPLDSAPLWKYTGKDGLKAPKVKAVEAFRKAMEDAAKKKP